MSCLVVGCVGIHSVLMHHYILFLISSCCGIYGQNYAAVCIHVLRGQFLSLHSQRVHSCAGKCSVLFLRCTERFRWPYFSVIFVTMMPPICWAAWGIFSDQPVCLCVLVCVHGGIVWPACQRFTLLCLIVRMFQVNNAHFFTRWHTHTRLTALCPGLPRWTGTRKVKPVWILLKQESVSGSGISWAVCKSAPRYRQTTTPSAPHLSVLQAGCPSCRPANSAKALKAT